MKKNLIILSMLTVFISFLFSIPVIDNLSGMLIYGTMMFYGNDHYETVGVNIESTNPVDNYTFFDKMDELANKNNLVVYVIDQKGQDGNSPEVIVYTSTNDIYLNKVIMLEKGYATGIRNKEIYSTYSQDDYHRILNYNMNVGISVRPLNQIERRSIYINLISVDNNAENNIKNFCNDLAGEFGTIDVYSPYNSQPNNISVLLDNFITLSQKNFSLKIGISLVLVVLLCLKVFSCSKKISILKIEGNTTFNIYRLLFIDNYIKYSFISIMLFLLGIFIIYHTNTISFIGVSMSLIAQFLQFIIIILTLSILIYLVIYYTPLFSSMKGYNHLTEVYYFSCFVKFLIVLFTLPMVFSAIESIYKYLIIVDRHDEVYESLENVYTFGIQDSSNEYTKDVGKEKYIKVKKDIMSECILFEQGKAKLIDWTMSIPNPEAWEDYYAVDKEYLINNNLTEGCNLEEICIYFKNREDVDVEKWVNAAQTFTREKMPVNIIDLNKDLQAWALSDLLYRDHLIEAPIIYVPVEKGLEGQLHDSLIIYDGNLREVQNYIDDKFIENGYFPFFVMNSQQVSYQILYNTYKNLYINNIVQFLIMVVAYALANRLLIEVDIDNNRKLYDISYYEGVQPYSLLIYILKVVSPSILALIGGILAKKISFGSLAWVLVFMFCMEAIMYLLFVYNHSKVRSYK